MESYLPAEDGKTQWLHYIVYTFTFLAGLTQLFSKPPAL